jgi:hypothetical protein
MVQNVVAKLPEDATSIPGFEPLSNITAEYHRDAVAAVNAATLVFAHAVADTAVDDLLDISIRGVPANWMADKTEFTLTLAQLRTLDIDHYVHRARRRLLDMQKKKSLTKKIEHLFAVSRCGPALFEAKLNLTLIGEADVLRQGIIHGAAITQSVENLNQMLGEFLSAANLAIFAVARSCGFEHFEDQFGIHFRPIR